MIQLETDRLVISELEIADAPFILKLTNTPGWLTYIGDRKIHSIADAEKYFLTGTISSYETHGFGLFKVSLKKSRQPIGINGLLKRPHLDHPDIGFAFLPEFEGNGFAAESSDAILNWATSSKKLSTILAITLPSNTRSIALLKRLGFSKIATFYKDDEELIKFELTFG